MGSVNGASLYHHFRSKEDILAGMVEPALAEVRGAGEPCGDWRQWLPENARNLRKAPHPARIHQPVWLAVVNSLWIGP